LPLPLRYPDIPGTATDPEVLFSPVLLCFYLSFVSVLAPENAPKDIKDVSFVVRNGVFTTLSTQSEPLFERPHDVNEFYEDLDELLTICNNGPVRSFSYTRLKLLEIHFKTHVQLNRYGAL
jgi:hypothetical protein